MRLLSDTKLDLQGQVRNQASGILSSGDKNCKSKIRRERDEGRFISQQALKAIDERSMTELPWWTRSCGDWLVIKNDKDYADSVSLSSNVSSQHRSQIILTPMELASVLLLGLKAPTVLGSLAVAILGFVYLPQCIKHDLRQQRIYINHMFKDEEES